MEDIVNIVQKMPPEAQKKIFSLLVADEKEKKQDWLMQSVGFSVGHLFFELEDYEAASNLFLKYEDYVNASKSLKNLGRIDKAKQSINRIFETFNTYRNNVLDIEGLLFEARGILSINELEELLIIEFNKFGNRYNRANDLNFKNELEIFEAFIAKEKGNHNKVEEIYNKSKRRLEEDKNLLSNGEDYEKIEQSWEYSEWATRYHAELCSVIEREEEAIRLYAFSETSKRKIFNERFYFWLEKIDREELGYVYDDIFTQSIFHTQPPDFFSGAKAVERLGRKEEAKKYYEKALVQMEEQVWLYSAFQIAKKLDMQEKVNLYTNISKYLYVNRFI